MVVLLPGVASATTREIAELQTAPLTIRQSVISELTDDILRDPYDEFQRRPFNLPYVNIERHANLSPWPGQQGEQNRYVDALIGNNGNTNVRNGSDVLQGTYLQQSSDKFSWGVSAAYLSDDVGNTDTIGGETFADGQQLTGFDLRFGAGYRLNDRMILGGGVSALSQTDEVADSTFETGVGGFYSLQSFEQTGVEVDFGVRRYMSGSTSWDAKLIVGSGETQVDDFSEDFDAAGLLISRFVVTEYDLTNTFAQISGSYNKRYADYGGEMQVEAGYRVAERELDNTNLSYADLGGAIVPTLELLAQDPVSSGELFASASTVFVRGQTQLLAGARIGLAQVDGATTVDSLGTIVDESIDDTLTRLNLTMGVRQPLWNEKLRLVASARANWMNSELTTSIDGNFSGADVTRTTTGYALGFESVLNNVVLDLAWLFGEGALPGATNEVSRQVVDLNRLVLSATLGW